MANGRNVAVPPRGRTSLLVDALVGPESTPVVHVVASGGVLTGVLEDSWIDGAVGRGADDASPAARPGLDRPAAAAFVAAVGGEPQPKYGWTDVARFSQLGVPAVNFGPGDALLAHTDDEHVSREAVHACLAALTAWLAG